MTRYTITEGGASGAGKRGLNMFRHLQRGMLAALCLTGFAAQAQDCPASASWFTDPSQPSEVANGLDANNCDFHQFAWQSFINSVQPAGNGELIFESWMPDYGVFVPSGTSVTPWGQQPAAPCSGSTALASKQFVRPRTPKASGDAIDPNSSTQATGDPLYDQANQLVYYSIWMNETEYNFITGCEFYNSSCITAAPQGTALPPGSIEVKAAWRQFSGAAPDDMYTIQGVVGSACTPVTLGLVGFHLVINTPLHPEFIWATFEHVDNAPDCSNPQPAPADGWSFNNPNCVANGQPCQTNQSGVVPTQACRVNPWGGGSSQNVANIQAINASVQSTLAGLQSSNPDVYKAMAIWQNYEMTGNLWTVNGQLPPNPNVQAGSLANANLTMETFFQPDGNCFTCHQMNGPFSGASAANISHLFHFPVQSGGCNNGAGPLPTSCPVGGTGAAITIRSGQ